ncbi:MAG: hypothetical protein U0T07_03320 [Chitinophagales bacterium]
MIKKNTTYLLILLAALIISSCDKDDDNNNNNIPTNCTNITGWIKNGHEWVYANNPILIYADSLFVNMQEVSTGIFKNTSTYDDGILYGSYFAYLKPCDNIIYQSTSSSMSNPMVAYHIDGAIGETWTSTVISSGGHTVSNTVEITAKNISVTVPAGTFSCIKYHMTSVSTQPGSITVESDIYFNNDYGMIKTDGNTTSYVLVRKNF